MAQAPARRTATILSAASRRRRSARRSSTKFSVGDDAEAAALVHGAIEEFAQELAYVTQRFLKTKAWDKTEAIIVGGGFRQSRIGEMAIARAGIILKAEGEKVEPDPDPLSSR